MAREFVAIHQPDCAVHDDKPCDCTCQRCKCCSLEFVDCSECGGEGSTLPGGLYEQDPLWYDFEDTEPCHMCGGRGGWMLCLGRCDEQGEHEQRAERGDGE